MKIENIYKLENGWTAHLDSSGKAILHVFPLENSIFRKEQIVTIPIETFEAIKNGDRNIKSLFKKYQLHNDIIQWDRPPTIPNIKHENTDTKYYGQGFISTKENDRFYLSYLLASHGGGNRKIEISETIYSNSRSGNYSLSDLFKKHDLFKFDNEEHDLNKK